MKVVINRVLSIILLILLGLIICSYFIVWYSDTGMHHCIGGFDRLQILYVAANQTSREIYCKVLNTGSHLLTVNEIKVNGSRVVTRDRLPIIIRPFCVRDYKTFVFRYDGPWKGSIVIGFHTLPFPADWEKLVDLQSASNNPIDGAYPDRFELLSIYFYRNLVEIARYMEAVLCGSITAFAGVVAQLVLINLKLRIKIKHVLVVMLLASSLFLYRLHTIKRPLVTFSDDGDIIGDGSGPYVDGVASMRIYVYDMAVYPSNGFGFDGYLSHRSVCVRLGDVHWKDENLGDIPPRPSRNLSMDLYITFPNDTIPKIGVGERLEPTEILMLFIDPDSGKHGIEILRDMAYYPPPPEFINEGHAYIEGKGIDTWLLDVDAWFRYAYWESYDVNPPKYWVRLSFKMTIKLQSLI